MRFFQTLASRLSKQASPVDAEIRLAAAYQRVFTGNPTDDDQSIVLADLADYAGYYRVTPPEGNTNESLWFQEGMRALYGRVFRYLRMSDAEMRGLETASREAAAQRAGLAPDHQGE